MSAVYADPCVTVELDAESSVVHFTRTDVPYPSLADFVSIHTQIGRALDRLGRDKLMLLVDMRRATMNNDEAFEKAAERARAVLVRGFPRVAVLVQTAVGALQVKRHVREDGRDIGVFSTERDALDFLRVSRAGPGRPERPESTDIEETPRSGVGLMNDGPFKDLARRAAKR